MNTTKIESKYFDFTCEEFEQFIRGDNNFTSFCCNGVSVENAEIRVDDKNIKGELFSCENYVEGNPSPTLFFVTDGEQEQAVIFSCRRSVFNGSRGGHVFLNFCVIAESFLNRYIGWRVYELSETATPSPKLVAPELFDPPASAQTLSLIEQALELLSGTLSQDNVSATKQILKKILKEN